MAEVQTLPDYPRGLTFEQVWAALMENREQLKETALQIRETDLIVKENAKRQEKTDQQLKENAKQQEKTDRQMKETGRQMKETDRRLGKLGNRFGDVIEYMVAPNLQKKFYKLGFNFHKANFPSKFRDYDNNIFFEVDIMLENGDKAMLVEVKSKPSTEDVKDHIERLEKMRKYADLHDDKRTFLGAVAGVVMADNVKEYVLKQGFFVIEPSGETFNIIPPNGEPKEW